MQRVLLIREQDGQGSALREEFERGDFEVTQAENVTAAIREMGNQAFDHVVSDCMLEHSNAALLMKSVSDRGADWMIMMTGKRANSQTVLRAIQLDSEHVVFEPLARSEMFTAQRKGGRAPHRVSVKEQIETLHHMRSAFYSSDIPMILLSASGIVSDINLAAERLLQVEHKSIVGSSFAGSIGMIAPELKRSVDSVLRSGMIVWVQNIKFAGRKAAATCDVRLRPILSPEGMIRGLWISLRDHLLIHDDVISEHDAQAARKLVGVSPRILQAIRDIERAAANLGGVLITGETGTSKRIAARMIHTQSERAERPFIVVDCSVIPETIFDDELFGSDGSEQHGKLAAASGGTLVLEDIELLPVRTQHKLLSYLRSHDLKRPAESAGAARIIGTARRPLVEAVARGHFDEAIFELLRGTEITIPPLRDRPGDVPYLVDYLLPRLNERLGLDVHRISAHAMDKLMRYSWPGNVQQLEIVLQEALKNCSGYEVLPEHLPNDLLNLSAEGLDLRQGKEAAQKRELIDVLNWAGWNKSKAARRLGISRETLYRRMEKFELEHRDAD